MSLLLLGKAAVLPHRDERPLAAEMDDEEQPARHGSALARSVVLDSEGGAAPFAPMQERQSLRSRAPDGLTSSRAGASDARADTLARDGAVAEIARSSWTAALELARLGQEPRGARGEHRPVCLKPVRDGLVRIAALASATSG